MVVQQAVVCNVGVRHDQAVVAYHGLTFRCRAAVYGGALADNSVVADDGECILTAELQILRYSTHHGGGKNGAVGTYTCATENGGVSHDLGAGAYHYVGFDICERTNLGCRVDNCFGVNTC